MPTTTLEERTLALRAHNDRLAAQQQRPRRAQDEDVRAENARLRATIREALAILSRVTP